ncbi:carboxypeptidase regulatory-like domain-containing protein, partial [bacterium]
MFYRLNPFPLFVFALSCTPVLAQNATTLHVVDAQNKPVVGALVQVNTGGGRWLDKTEKTDANGRATLDLPTVGSEAFPTKAIVVAPGFAFYGAVVTGPKAEIQLEKGTVWRGKVVDAEGTPVVGATIAASSPDIDTAARSYQPLNSSQIAAAFTAISAQDGSFEIKDVPLKGLNYTVAAPGFISLKGETVPSANAQISLTKGAVLTGRILGLDGQPLRGIRALTRIGELSFKTIEVETQADGTFRFDTLPPGTYDVNFQVPKDAAYLVPGLAKVRVERGVTAEPIEVRAVAGVVVKGVVRCPEQDGPVSGASIWLSGSQYPGRYPQKIGTDAAGNFAVRCLPGKIELNVLPPKGYLDASSSKELTVTAETPEPLLFNLRKMVSLRGTIVDANGKPISAAVLMGNYSEIPLRIASDQEGRWSLDATSLSVQEARNALTGDEDEDGYYETMSPHWLDVTQPGEVTIRLQRKNWLVLPGRAVTSKGQPIAGVKIKATFSHSDPGSGLPG